MTTNTTMPTIQVEINNVNGQHVPAITSLQVAEVFGKRHDHVLRDIEEILTQASENFGKTNFGGTEYPIINNLGFAVNKPMYLLTRDGFSMLAMGYNGQKAFQFKEAILARLKELEASLQMNVVALPNFADPVAAARAWANALEQKQEAEQQLALATPKAEVYDAVVADKELTLYQLARKITGINCTGIKRDLLRLGYLYKTKYQAYRVYSEYRGILFEEKLINGTNDIIVLDAGKKELVRLHKQGLLTGRKGRHGA